MRKKSFFPVALLAILVMLVACGGAQEPVEQEPVTISFWKGPHTSGFSVDGESAAMTPLIEKFEAENPDIKVEYLIIPWTEFNEKLITGMSSKKPPDVVYIPAEWMFQFAQADLLLDFNEDPELIRENREAMPPGLFEKGKYGEKQVGIPWLTDSYNLFYNKKLFIEAGLDPEHPPDTWDELVEYAVKLTKDIDGDGSVDQWGYPIHATGAYDDGYFFYTFLWGAGADILNDDWTAPAFNNDKGLEALQLYTDFFLKYEVTPLAGSFNRNQLIELFVEGKIAMIQEEQQTSVRAVVEDHPELELGVAKMPAGPVNHTAWGNIGLNVVNANTENKEAALKFLAYLSSPEMQKAYFSHTDFWAARTDVTGTSPDNTYLTEMGAYRGYITLWPLHPRLSEINTRFYEEIEPALHGSITPEEALQNAADAVQVILDANPVSPGG